MDELDERFDELRRTVEPRVHQPDFGVIRRRHRRRVRNQRVATGSLAAVAILAGYGVATRALDDAAPLIETTAAVVEYVPPPTGEFGSRDVAFVDRRQGWALGSRCSASDGVERCAMGVSRTTDAGRTWTAPAQLGPVVPKEVLRTSTDPATGAARSIRFFNSSTGYAFNPALYVTRDAGASWAPVPVPAQVVGVGVSSLGVLVVTRDCPAPGGCTARVLRDRDAAGELVPLPAQPPTVGTTSQLRLANNDIWVLSYGEGTQRLVHSTNVGRTWETRETPCREYDHQHLSATNDSLWVACTVEDGPRKSAKQVHVSTDGGRTWQRRGTPDAVGVTNDLKAIDSDVAFLSSSHGDLLRTTDGGRTWEVAAEGEGYINLEFPFGDRGWFFGPAGALWQYAEGRAERLQGPS